MDDKTTEQFKQQLLALAIDIQAQEEAYNPDFPLGEFSNGSHYRNLLNIFRFL